MIEIDNSIEGLLERMYKIKNHRHCGMCTDCPIHEKCQCMAGTFGDIYKRQQPCYDEYKLEYLRDTLLEKMFGDSCD